MVPGLCKTIKKSPVFVVVETSNIGGDTNCDSNVSCGNHSDLNVYFIDGINGDIDSPADLDLDGTIKKSVDLSESPVHFTTPLTSPIIYNKISAPSLSWELDMTPPANDITTPDISMSDILSDVSTLSSPTKVFENITLKLKDRDPVKVFLSEPNLHLQISTWTRSSDN